MLPIFFIAASLAAQETSLCPPGQYYSADFNTPPIYIGLGPNPAVLPPFTPPIDGLRGIYWVHGFGGDQNSLAQVKTATDEGAGSDYKARKTVGVLMTYATTGLPAAGSDLNDKILGADGTLTARGVTDFSNNFIIAHSQGGIVSRWADMELENDPPTARRIHGIATFGSPHNGAQIVNSRNSGLVNEFATDACNAVLTTAAASLFEEKPIISLFLDLNGLTVRIEDLCETVPGAVLPFALGKFFSGVSNGYAVGAAELGELNGYSSAVHKASFHGVEFAKPSEDPSDNGFTSKQLLWRTLGSPPDAVSNAPVFSANDDQDLVNWANTLMAEYQATYEQYESEILFYVSRGMPCSAWEWITNFSNCASYDHLFWSTLPKRDIYLDAWRWSQGVDSQWKIIIGAKANVISDNFCQCISLDNYDDIIIPGPANKVECSQYGLNHPNEVKGCHWVTEYETVIRESDGVVTAESAQGYPGAGESMLLNNSNHFQLRNSTQTKDGLVKLFNEGGQAGESFFITKIK